MALNAAKVTLIFEQGGYGWTESYFLPAPSSDLQAEFAKGVTLASKRIKLCGKQTTLPFVKVSNEDVKRDVLVSGANFQGKLTEDSDAPDTALLCNRFGSTPAVRSPIFLRGVWDSIIVTGGQFDQTNAQFVTVFNSWRSYLIGNGWGFLARDPAISGTSGVATVTSNGNGTVTVTTEDGIFVGLPTGSKIKAFIAGVQGAASINGQSVWTVNSGASITSVNRIPMFPYTTGGQVTYRGLKFYAITAISPVRIAERKVGRPLFHSVGRRRGRKLA